MSSQSTQTTLSPSANACDVNVLQNLIRENHEQQNDIVDKISHVVGVQPDHPDRQSNADELIEYAVVNKYDDLVTVY